MASVAEQRVRSARARASFLRPYFTAAIFALVIVESEAVPTIGVDRYKRLYFNPKWIAQYSVTELTTVVLHEIGHVLRDHHLRARAIGVTALTAQDANVAQDCALNDDIASEIEQLGDLKPLPDPKDPAILALPEEMRGPFYPWKIGCEDGHVWEHYYRHMRENAPEEPEDKLILVLGGDCGSGAHGVTRSWDLGDPEDCGIEGVSDADWEDVKDIVARAITEHAKTKGSVPNGWLEWSNTLLSPPVIQWDQLLASNLRWGINDAAGMVTHSYQRPSRRQSAFRDFVMPNMRRPIPFICVIGDTSGSMDETQLAYVRGVVRDICQSLGAKLAFLATDAAVHGGMQMVHDGHDVELRGRGGTNMCVGIDYALTNVYPKPDVIMVCTDCETGWPAVAPPIKTIVCAIGATPEAIASVPKWAKVIEVPVEEAA